MAGRERRTYFPGVELSIQPGESQGLVDDSIRHPHSCGAQVEQRLPCVIDVPEAVGRDHEPYGSDDAQPERSGTFPGSEIIKYGPRGVEVQTRRDDSRLAGSKVHSVISAGIETAGARSIHAASATERAA